VLIAEPKKRRKIRRVPPGQRLVAYLGLALVFTLGQGLAPDTNTGKSMGQGAANLDGANNLFEPPFALTNEQIDLEERLNEMCSIKSKLRPGLFVSEPKTGRYIDLSGKEQFAAASMIKVPVLVSVLSALDRGQLKMSQSLLLDADLIAAGSGILQWRPVGSKISVREAIELMIVISDNTATNLLINAVGGKDKLNHDFSSWGLCQTKINNWLGDFTGTNKTSPYDLVYLLGRLDRGELLKPESWKLMLATMEKTKTRTLLPPGLGTGAKIAHKTGDIGSMVGDVGIVTTAGGERYIIAVQVERPHNDRRANELIRNLSKEIYQCFGNNLAAK
jgi:beta-lactamase class A